MASSAAVPEFEPPQACIGRIIKNVLPENVQITKEARSAFTRAAGIFIFYLTSCANEYAKENRRTTISSQDVRNAIKELDFDELDGPLAEFLEAYRNEMEAKKAVKPKKTSAAAAADGEEDNDAEADVEVDVDVDVEDDAEQDNGEVEGDVAVGEDKDGADQ